MNFKLKDLAKTDRLASREQARSIWNKMYRQLKKSDDEAVVLDYEGIRITGPTFTDELLYWILINGLEVSLINNTVVQGQIFDRELLYIIQEVEDQIKQDGIERKLQWRA